MNRDNKPQKQNEGRETSNNLGKWENGGLERRKREQKEKTNLNKAEKD